LQLPFLHAAHSSIFPNDMFPVTFFYFDKMFSVT
jgi:hypothetical protein